MASRANHRLFEAFALLCAAAIVCVGPADVRASDGPPLSAPATTAPATAPSFPIAMGARLAGDDQQTRFVLDLDKSVPFRAFTLGDPYRVVVDLPQVNFQLDAAVGSDGRGLVKAFRYGLIMPGGSRIVFDLTGPAKISNAYVLGSDNGQPARLVLEFSRSTARPSTSRCNRPASRNCGRQSLTSSIPRAPERRPRAVTPNPQRPSRPTGAR